MNYTTHVGVPSAHLTRKKSRLKVYNGHNVFLNDGDNFEFELHNPKNKSVLVKIKLNGEYISTAGVVIRPGQRVFLERFLDSNNKFVFSTYSVRDNDENRSAIAHNGDVEIEFYDEETPNYYPHLSGGNWSNGWTKMNTGTPYYGDITFTTNSMGVPTSNTNSLYSNNSFEGPNIRSKFDTSKTILRSNSKSKKSIETGRVEKGDSSNQTFTNSYQNFSYAVSKRYEFKILPSSQKNKTSDEIRQYCTECGSKIKQKYKYCYNCGNKL